MFYIETISNPLLDIADIPAVAAFCQENSLTSVIDNTFASPAVVRQAPHTLPAALQTVCRNILHMQKCTNAKHRLSIFRFVSNTHIIRDASC